MITSLKVGAVFEITDRALPFVQRLATEMEALAKSTAAVRAEMASLSSIRIGSIGNRVAALAGNMDKAATAAAAMSSATVQGAAAMDAGLTTALATARALTAQLAAAGRAGSGIRLPPGGVGGVPPGLPPPLPGAGGGRGGHGGGGPRGPHFGRIGAHMGPAHASVPGTTGTVGAGLALWSVFGAMHQAEEPLHQEAMLRLLGLDDAQVASAIAQARATATAVPGSGFAQNIKSIGEMYSVVGLQGSLQLSEKMAQVDRAMALAGKGTEEGSSYVLTRAGELMGRLTDPHTHQVDLAGFGAILDTMSRVVVATHGKVTPAEWLNYAKQAGPASGSLTGEGLYTTAAIIQAMGGYRAGTAAQALQRQFAGGKMTKPVALELQRLGLAKPDDFEFDHGHVIPKTDAMKELVGKLQRDPLSAVVDTIAPALAAKGITTPEDISREIYKFVGTGPAQREIYEIMRGREQIKQERERAMKGLAPDAALPFAQEHDPVQAMKSFTTAFKDFLGAVGSPAMQAAVPMLNGMTSIFNSMSAWAGGHKATAGVLGTVAAGAAGGAGLGFASGWLGGPVGAGGGALIGAGVGGGLGLWGVLPEGIKSGASTGFWAGNKVVPGMGGVFGGMVGGMWGALPSVLPGSTPAGAASQTVNKVDANITVKAETDNPQGLAEKLLAIINRLMAQGHLHNQGEADSVQSSPFTTGYGVP